ncbi:MAG: FAD-dependent oxidoreductase, partial [Planctomycetes bacterium]|nr:FAD-dependent oxidoreductase [Planctomycetota bacterium]
IGAGPIGCELAQAFARLGARVSLVSKGGRILPREDPDAGGIVASALLADGVDIVDAGRGMRSRRDADGKVLDIDGDGGTRTLHVDAILVGVGRKPNVEGLDLERAGVAYDAASGVQVDDRLRTTNRRIYAAGDICSRFKFTHAADAMARIVIRNALFFGRERVSSLVIPWCTYTDPEIAQVGLSEHDARERGVAVETIIVPMGAVDRAVLDGDEQGMLKMHLRRGTDRILGATLVARHAGDLIAEITLAMTAGLGLSAIGRAIHPYPTHGEVVRKAADAYNRSRLTPFVRRITERLMAWRR